MSDWVSFDDRRPEEGQFVAAIDNRTDSGWSAIGVWLKGEVWEGGNDLNGFTHWLPLPPPPICKEPVI